MQAMNPTSANRSIQMRPNQHEKPYLRLVVITDCLEIIEAGAGEGPDGHQDFAGGAPLDVFLEAGIFTNSKRIPRRP